MQVSKKKQFLVILIAFFALGASFKVMTLVEGLTEVRPVNAIPPVAGLVCGPIGALACGIGNLLADLFGSFNLSSILGVIANFIAAYLPYRLWHLFSDESPNLHKRKNILLYVALSLTTAMTVAWILSFGLNTFFGTWIEEIYTYVFFNNLGFSIGLGMPLLIILTSDSVAIKCENKPKRVFFLRKVSVRNLFCLVYLVIMLTLFVCIFLLHMDPSQANWLDILSILSAIGLVCQLV